MQKEGEAEGEALRKGNERKGKQKEGKVKGRIAKKVG